MLKLAISDALHQEFATVRALWESDAETRRVDALLLSWVKYEKQLRRLFCFLVFQHPNITGEEIAGVISELAANDRLYPETFIRAIKSLGVAPVPTLVGARHTALVAEVQRIKKYRNKLMHGQVTGLAITSRQLERDVLWLVDWIECLSAGAQAIFGYDGLRRKTFRAAKSTAIIAVEDFPFSTPAEFGAWLRKI